jgi:2-hydroxy fatty acid dioxygenase
LDNIFQAVFLAPFFVWFEVGCVELLIPFTLSLTGWQMLFAMGYRPELRARVESEVTKAIAKYRASKKAKSDIQLDNLSQNGKAINGQAK